MKPPSEQLLPLITVAAELRAGGSSWTKVGEQTNRSAETCRQWARRHPDVWARLYREAEGHIIAEASAEARTLLRKLLRSDQPRIVLGAATLLLRAREQQRLQEVQADRPTPSQLAADILEFVKHLKGLTDAQLAAFVDDFLVRLRPAAGSAAAGAPGPASPPPPQ